MAEKLAQVLAEKLEDGDISEMVNALQKSAPRRSAEVASSASGQQSTSKRSESCSSLPCNVSIVCVKAILLS